jgi:hypothetical protein
MEISGSPGTSCFSPACFARAEETHTPKKRKNVAPARVCLRNIESFCGKTEKPLIALNGFKRLKVTAHCLRALPLSRGGK